MSSVIPSRMSVIGEDGLKVAEFSAKLNTKTVHKADIKAFSREVKRVSSGLEEIGSGKLSFMQENAVRSDVAHRLKRCLSMMQDIETKFAATTYQHNRKKLEAFTESKIKLSKVMKNIDNINKLGDFKMYQTEMWKQRGERKADDNAKLREMLKRDPDFRSNGGMIK